MCVLELHNMRKKQILNNLFFVVWIVLSMKIDLPWDYRKKLAIVSNSGIFACGL